jgi:hypothetical protein
MEIDPETGFPFLPEDLAWKVSQVNGLTETVAVCIVIKRPKPPSRSNDVDRWDDYGNFEEISYPTSEGLAQAAATVYRQTKEQQDKQRKIKEVVGIYELKR